MPVVDGVFTPRLPLTLAEQHVDFPAVDATIVGRRREVERAALGPARAVAAGVAWFGLPSMASVARLEVALDLGLRRTVRLGAAQVRREVRDLRAAAAAEAREVPDAGRYPELARLGLAGILEFIRRRARDAAHAVAAAAAAAAAAGDDETVRVAVALQAAARTLHNQVLELVGEALNLGRTAAALEMSRPPQFAMRSEQLDKGTCDPCIRLHGEVVEVGSASYFDYLPPAGCLGGGRCRGLVVFADGPEQVRGPETPPGPQPDLAPIPPVRFPERRAA
ncbi:MAG: hypothetical protein KJ058_00475 [Thermoanaerobaculia bacterium]|nr:hypothetical protein [Thermoanaerobaculia bacterium]